MLDKIFLVVQAVQKWARCFGNVKGFLVAQMVNNLPPKWKTWV